MSDPLPTLPEFPTAASDRSTAASATGTPRPLDALVGREDDVQRVLALLDEPGVRLLTLTGPGGVGKTRLALEVMATIERDFADGAVFLPLAAVRDTRLVPTVVARACGIAVLGQAAVLAQGLRARHQLLVLDNYEHLLDADPAWLADVLEACPLLTMLVTSRTALNIAGEQRYPVPTLGVSAPSANPVEPAATTLFCRRAHAVRPDFRLTPENRDDIDEVCRRLDGVPLAIELAAARINVLTPGEMVDRLWDRFALLRGGSRDAPECHRSILEAIAWSYDLLSSNEQHVFRTLSVFVGGFALEAAETVIDHPADSAWSAIDIVDSLVEKSLIQPVERSSGEPRFAMLETIREFGLAQLVLSGEEVEVRNRHAKWCLTLAKETRANPVLILSAMAVDRLESDYANIQATLTWLGQTGQAGQMLRFMNDLEFLWNFGGHDVEGLAWYKRVLDDPRNGSPSDRLDALSAAGILAHAVGDSVADAFINEAVALARDVGTLAQRANAVSGAAIRAEDLGDYAKAESMLRESRTYTEQAGLEDVAIMFDYHLGVVAYGQDDLALAVDRLEAARRAATALGDPFIPLWWLVYLALIACERNDLATAADLLRQHPPCDRVGYQQHQPLVRAAAGVLATRLEHHQMAARFFGATAHDVGLFYPERVIVERCFGTLREMLGDESFAEA